MYGKYYWIIGEVERVRKSDGMTRRQKLLLGGYNTIEEADQKGFAAFNGLFERYELETRSKPAAASLLRHKLWESTDDLVGALEPILHKPPGESESGGLTNPV